MGIFLYMRGTWLRLHKIILPTLHKTYCIQIRTYECCNIYYTYVNNDDKLKSKVLIANGEAPKPYVALTAASMFSTSMVGLCEFGV